MRRLLTLLAILALVPVAVVTAPLTGAAAASDCPTLLASTTEPATGAEITLSGTGFDPGATVRLVLNSDELATARTSTTGSFSTRGVLPSNVTGRQRLESEGGQSACRAAPITLDIRTAGVDRGDGSGVVSLEIALLGLAALILVVGGVIVTTLGRHRRSARR